jgi:hypothetical protein
MPARIVTAHYRYKRPPRKRKAVPLGGLAIARGSRKREKVSHAATLPEPANNDLKPAIVTAKRQPGRLVTPEWQRQPTMPQKGTIL